MIIDERPEPLDQQPGGGAGSGTHRAGIAPAGKAPAPVFAAISAEMKADGDRYVGARERQAGEPAKQPSERVARRRDRGAPGG